MNRLKFIFGWLVFGLTALVVVNLILFGFVVGLDIAFGEAPEFVVPTLVPVMICGVTGTAFLIRRRRNRSLPESELEQGSAAAQTGLGANTGSQGSLLRSVLVIRRQPASHFHNHKKGAYETSI